jgi:predicted nucleic acid-binding protein
VIIDASVVLRGFFPDEEGQAAAQAILHAYVQQEIDLQAPTLLPYEFINAIHQAVKRKRLDAAKGKEILTAFFDLGIRTVEVSWQRVFELACTYDRSAYDGAYLALAEATGSKLVTGDRHLYNAVRDHLPWVLWIGDYSPI